MLSTLLWEKSKQAPERFAVRVDDDLGDGVLVAWLQAEVLGIEWRGLDGPRGTVVRNITPWLTIGDVVSVRGMFLGAHDGVPGEFSSTTRFYGTSWVSPDDALLTGYGVRSKMQVMPVLVRFL